MRKMIQGVMPILAIAGLMVGCAHVQPDFIRVVDKGFVDEQGQPFYPHGTNLGNWLNPEGYMFGLKGAASSARTIDALFEQGVGPFETREFWKEFKETYITEADIQFIASTGANVVRVPFHYRLFTAEDYLGESSVAEGFQYLDRVIGWCRKANLHVILDMHDCPGGQTGDNIDDSAGYPWLFEDARAQALYTDIWVQIAQRYRDEPVVFAYELMNEPIPHYMDNQADLKVRMVDLCEKVTKAIRTVDATHVILWPGANWNVDFSMWKGEPEDPQVAFTCHRYEFNVPPDHVPGILDFIAKRDYLHRPFVMGETGHNHYKWIGSMADQLKEANIGLIAWPYKMMEGKGQSFVSFPQPEGWQAIRDFSGTNRTTFAAIRAARPDRAAFAQAMKAWLEAAKQAKPCNEYLKAMRFKVSE